MRRALAALVAWIALAPTPADARGLLFAEVAERWGIEFRHHHGGSGSRYMVETMGGGVVLLDYDGDGDDDLFFVDGGALPGYAGEEARSVLLRNDGGAFRDVTAAAGIELDVYGSGGTAGDVDGDGDIDLYVTAFGPNRLFRNRGDGTFEEGAESAGVADGAWGASAAFADVDRDGDLDLYVANYVDFRLESHRMCREVQTNVPIYCQPGAYAGLEDRFFRNRGDGTFEERTAAHGLLGIEPMAGLGVVFADVDNDGWPDLYVANDTEPNFLFFNLGDGTFEDRSFVSGTAVGERGQIEAGMGVDAGDIDGDGWTDLVVTNFEQESNALYRNLGAGVFLDHRYPSKVAESSLRYLAFGVDLGDFDADGDLDLVIANGHVRDNAPAVLDTSRYAQRNQLLENLGDGSFREVEESGLDVVRVSRGLAVGDLDLDGDLDLVIVNSNDLAEAYENLSVGGTWLLVDLVSSTSAPGGVGARLSAAVGGATKLAEVRTSSSYLSQNTLSAHFGLGGETRVDALRVDWPSGRGQRFVAVPASHRLTVVENGR